MSTNASSSARPDDAIVALLSRWLAGRLTNGELRRSIVEIGTGELAPEQAEAVEELLGELALAGPGERGEVEKVLRETFETLALG